MLLTMILDTARDAEFKTLSPKDKTDKVIIGYLNTALIALYSRFFIKTEEALIALKTGKTLYKFDGTDADVTVKGQPIAIDSFMAIINAFNMAGKELSINDTNDVLGVFTSSFDTLQVPYSTDGAYVAIIYRENPTLLNSAVLCDTTTGALLPENSTANVYLPLQLLEPLLHYIAYRGHGSVAGDIKDENNIHYMRYNASCIRIEKSGVVDLTNLQSRNVKDKGFV